MCTTSIAYKERRRCEDNHGEKIAMMQQCSTEYGSAVHSRRRLTNFKMLVSQSVSVSSLETVCLTTVKGTLQALRRRLTYIFSRSITGLIYYIFTYKVWTLNFYRKGLEI